MLEFYRNVGNHSPFKKILQRSAEDTIWQIRAQLILLKEWFKNPLDDLSDVTFRAKTDQERKKREPKCSWNQWNRQ